MINNGASFQGGDDLFFCIKRTHQRKVRVLKAGIEFLN